MLTKTEKPETPFRMIPSIHPLRSQLYSRPVDLNKPLQTNTSQLIDLWKSEVFDKANEIDPDNERDWYSLCVGWMIGKGYDAETATDFARHIRYNTDLG